MLHSVSSLGVDCQKQGKRLTIDFSGGCYWSKVLCCHPIVSTVMLDWMFNSWLAVDHSSTSKITYLKLYLYSSWTGITRLCLLFLLSVVLLCLVYTAYTDKTNRLVLSCIVLVSGVNRMGDMSRLSATKNLKTVSSCLKMRCEQSFVLSRPILQQFIPDRITVNYN